MSAAALLAGGAASASAAAVHPAASVQLKGGRTSVTTGPGIALTLLKNGIVPIATWPGTQSLVSGKGGPAARFTFPVTGGRVSLSPPSGDIRHRGGILFFNAANGKHVQVSRFTIDLKHADLTGIVNGNAKVRVPLFNLSLAHAKIKAGNHVVTVRGIVVKLTAVAAKALNAALGTKLFASGLTLGTASTTLRF
ncbi:MAG TPA: hypothetical protein VF843_09825 [Streptosporangiaceae bacterium]